MWISILLRYRVSVLSIFLLMSLSLPLSLPERERQEGRPIWFWLWKHSPLSENSLKSLIEDPEHDLRLDGFMSFLRTEMHEGCLCVNPTCPGCPHSGQDVLLFVHKLSTYLRNHPQSVNPQLVLKLVLFSKECRTVLGNTVNKISQRWLQQWRFLSFDRQRGLNADFLNRKDYYKIFAYICKPLLISLARLFFSIFRQFLMNPSRDFVHPSFKVCIEELLLIQQSYAELGASSLYEFSFINQQSAAELGSPEKSLMMHKLFQATGSSVFGRVRMPNEIFESALEVFLEHDIEYGTEGPLSLSSGISDPEQLSILRGMGLRQELLSFLRALCCERCDKALELISLISSVPLKYRDESHILNLDDARAFRGTNGYSKVATRDFLLKQADHSDKDLHAAFLNLCDQKLQHCLESSQQVDDLLDFAKALQSVVALVSDTSSSTYLKLCYDFLNERQRSVFSCCVALAQLCINKAASDGTSPGHHHASAAFVFISVAISIAQKQKLKAIEEPQISKNIEIEYSCFSDMSNVGKFHDAIAKIDKSSPCRFVSSWLLANGGQFFNLFRLQKDLLSSLVPLNEEQLLRDCVVFVQREAYQQYIPSACFSWLSAHTRTFSKVFVSIFSTQGALVSRIPQCISPFPPPFCPNIEGHLVCDLFSVDEVQQKAAGSIISNIICSDPAAHMHLVGSILLRIKNGDTLSGSRVAIQAILPVMEHPGLHGDRTAEGGIQGGWHSRDEFFMTLLHGRSLYPKDKTAFLNSLSVHDLLEQSSSPNASKVSLINTIFADLILFSRGISASQSMWRLENPDKAGMISLFFPSARHQSNDDVVDKLVRVFDLLNEVYKCDNFESLLLFSPPEMIGIAAALLSARNFALRRPLFDVYKFLSCLKPHIARVEKHDPAAAEAVAKSIFSFISPEFYVASLNNAKCFQKLCALVKWSDSTTVGLLDIMNAFVSDSFCSTLRALKELSQSSIEVGGQVGSHVIFLYFDCLQSMFSYCASTFDTLQLLERSNKARDAMASLDASRRHASFVCEVWPEPVLQSATFSATDIVSVLKIISTTKNFEFVWAIAKDIHNCLLFKVDLSRRCRLLRPMHRVIAHAISFLAQTCVTFMSLPDESYKSQKSDAFTQLVELCNVVVPSDFHEGNWLMALPVVREIFSQQTSFLSSASSMFLGVPVLVEGHLFDATHTPWVLGKVKEQAGSIANGCYYDHPLFVECDHQTYDKTSMYSPVDCFSATRSIFICMAFDFLGTRSSFLSWLHKVVSCDLSQYASDAVSEFKFCEKWCAWGAGVDPQFKFLNYFKNAQTDESKRKIRQGNAFLQKVFTAVPGSEEFFLEAGWSLQLAEPLAGRSENIYEFKGHEERLRSACAILTPPFHLTPHFHEAQFHGAVAADILALLPTFKRNDAMTSSLWENIHALGRLEYEEFFKLDQRGRGLFMMSFATSCLEVQSLFRTCRLSTQQQKYLQPLTDLQKLQEEDKAHLSDREISNIFQSFSEILLDADGSSRLSAHARCLMSGSFFRVSACGIIFRIPYIQVESRALVNLCQSFCLWFANLEAAKSDTFADEIKRNTFSSITAIGQETIRAAVHCLLLLPDASVNVPVALAHLSPVLTESHPNLIEIAVSTLTKSSIFHRSASDLGAEKVLQIVSSILFNQLDAKTSAFQVVLGRPSLFLKLCDWLMMNHHDYHCGHLLIRLISEQNFPKVCDVLPPRSCMTGLVNVGNTCFIASLYQQLASIPSFVAALQSCTFGPEGARLVLTQQSKTVVFRELLGKIMNQRQCLNSDVVEGFFRKLGFSLDRQQDDPLSVLSSMVSWIVAETSDYDRHKHGDETKMKQTALDSPVLFHTIVSQMRKHVSWQDCTCSSQCTEIESFFDGTITLIEDKKHPTGCQSMKSIEEVLRARLNERTTEDQCSCRSGQSKCKISLEFEKLPQVLIVGLNARVEFVGSQLSPLKDNRVPSISSELDISKCAKLSSSAAEGNTVYTLNGIILHHGSSVSSGHYTSLIRRSDSEWIHLDDNLASAVDASDMKSVLHRGGKELPRVDYACPTHLTGKPCVLFYVRKTVSHPCSSVLFDSRLVEKTLVTTVQSPILESAIARDTISLCFRLAPLFARENDRLRSIASIANQLLLPEYEEYFLQLASSDDPELFLAMCRNRSTSSDFHGCYFKEVALKLTDVAPHFSSRAVHRRLASCFEIALQLPSDLHAQIVDKICSFGIASESLLTGAERQPLSTKCYAVLKSISDLPDDSPFIRHFSEHERFALAVSALDNSMCSATSDQETNLVDDDEDRFVPLSRTATASTVFQKLRSLMIKSAGSGIP